MSRRQMHINLFLRLQGNHMAGWRSPGNQIERILDPAYYIEIAQKAEAAKYDSLFIADGLSLISNPWKSLSWLFEPLTLLALLSGATKHIGLIGTASTTYAEPYNVARAFASLDHLSQGRSGWNIVTTASAESDANFGGRGYPDHADRYERAAEFVDVVRALWGSWESDALVADRAIGILTDYGKVHAIDHVGKHYAVKGPLTSPRPPQGEPLLVQAGASASGRAFAGTYADAVYAPGDDFDATASFTRAIREQAVAAGRAPGAVKVLAALCPILGGTEAEANGVAEELSQLSGTDHVYSAMMSWFGLDLTTVGPDDPIPLELLPNPAAVQGFRSRYEQIHRLISEQGFTIRQIGRSLEGSNDGGFFVGTPEQLAERMATWWQAGAVDGFNLSIPFYNRPFIDFNEQVLPLLRRRGLFREDYQDETLRQRFAG